MADARFVACMALALLGGCQRPAKGPPASGPAPLAAPSGSGPAPLSGWQLPVSGGWSRSWRVRVAWGEGEVSKDCYFLSGPLMLGRQTSLGNEAQVIQQGESVRLSFGTKAEFDGTLRDGTLSLHREGSYDDKGPWTTHETIEGPLDGAIYRYSECDKQGKQGCPTRCVIKATLALRSSNTPP